MAERRNKRDVCLEYTFDRLLVAKLEQVYRTLVPDRVRVVGEPAPAQAGVSKLIGAGDEDGGDLRPGILGQAEGGEHHRQPNGGADRVRHRARLRCCASTPRAASQRASQKPSRPASKASAIRVMVRPALTTSSRQRCSKASSRSGLGSSFLRG
jgi:hypothetical protein